MTGDATTAPPHQRSVFISYAYNDRPAAERLRAAFERAGMKAAEASDSIAAGDNVLAAVSSLIERADVVVVLVSPRSVESDWVETEAAIAVGRVLSGRGGRVVPVLLGDVEVPFVLRDFQEIRVKELSQLEHVADTIAVLPAETIVGEDELRRSAEYQRNSIEHDRAGYEIELQMQGARQGRVAVVLAITLSGLVAAILVAAVVVGSSDVLSTVLAPVTALLASAIGFYFGRSSAADDPAKRERPNR